MVRKLVSKSVPIVHHVRKCDRTIHLTSWQMVSTLKWYHITLLPSSSATSFIITILSQICPPIEIQSNLKFFPFFKGAIGAMDGTHISCCPSAAKQELSCNHKGWMSQNCLACCSFDMLFQYMLSRWDGSAADAVIFNNAWQSDLRVPDSQYYLANAGFGACESLLVPYQGVRYCHRHIQWWVRLII